MGIRKETLEFVEKAKEYFEKNIEGATYLDKEKGYIALRWGLMDDCIKVYELGDEVGFFENWCKRYSDQEKIDYLIDELANKAIYITDKDICKLLNKVEQWGNKSINIKTFKCFSDEGDALNYYKKLKDRYSFVYIK